MYFSGLSSSVQIFHEGQHNYSLTLLQKQPPWLQSGYDKAKASPCWALIYTSFSFRGEGEFASKSSEIIYFIMVEAEVIIVTFWCILPSKAEWRSQSLPYTMENEHESVPS